MECSAASCHPSTERIVTAAKFVASTKASTSTTASKPNAIAKGSTFGVAGCTESCSTTAKLFKAGELYHG